jgi:putative glutamine amidotransferase
MCQELLGTRTRVSSLHHQAVARTGPGWRVTAVADDGVVEALEWEGAHWTAVGVQWHPEMDATGPALFGWLVSQARPSDVIRIGCYDDQGV